MHYSPQGISITFHGWMLKSHRCTLLFPYLKSQERNLWSDQKVLKRSRCAYCGQQSSICQWQGKPFTRFNFTPFFYHMIDHRTYQGLSITCHPLRIGRATARHGEGMELQEIMKLGRMRTEQLSRTGVWCYIQQSLDGWNVAETFYRFWLYLRTPVLSFWSFCLVCSMLAWGHNLKNVCVVMFNDN